MKTMKKVLAILTLLTLVLSCTAAFADGKSVGSDVNVPAENTETINRLLDILDFKFFVKKEGIGRGACPVYSAPSEDAYRAAEGKASCDTNAEISVAGFDASGWLMVRYDIKKNVRRIGYIPPKYVKGYKADVSKINFDDIIVEAAADLAVTDNPNNDDVGFATIAAGEQFHILGKYTYTGNWWYVECTVNGQTARGFINRNNSAIKIDGKVYTSNKEIGYPAESPKGTVKNGIVKVTKDGACIVRRKPDADSAMVARVYGGDSYPCYGSEKASNGRDWYYIWDDGVWGFISSGVSAYEAE